MPSTELDDAREYVFPLFLVESRGNGVFLEGRVFLGTAFFVTKRGDAITANHVLPKPDALPQGKQVIAVVRVGEEQQICWITHYASFEHWDLAVLHVNLKHTKYLPLSEDEVIAGTDLKVIGIPNHEVWMSGKEMRVLKGHVTLSGPNLELNISIPPGMSGSPVLDGRNVVAFAIKSVKSEEIEDYIEEVEVVSNNKEQIRITKTISVTHYGLAYPFSMLRNLSLPALEDRTLMQFVRAQNMSGRADG